ncbi:PREDICTED: zinc finger imprinted 3-like [Atta cephalotes]|uniref:C2H2-type domain-containing protein n=2 Tax=Atta TaxID=12956 RepID=A0A158NET0_ATTCE|nr:PREDICTED: zinc finger imprinted 3-like [Atta cephalotes]XP_018057353.1 PREDICTED: zinc finger imprinted 3-like [Atta colombica]XP_018057354.1 PREDICTED: zinc finger imprinted 3-like [Atta colombica]KYM76090.1 Zinc finger protein 81 [Atta colombica]
MNTGSKYNCVLCNSKLDTKEALQQHFRQHANKEIDGRGRPIERKSDENTLCDICNQSFDSIRATIRHRFKMHPNSPTKFHCSYCGQQFPLKNHRDTHQTLHDATESENKDQHRKCEECDLLFYNEKALEYHCKFIHKRMVHLFQPIATPPPSNKIKFNSMNDAMNVYYCHLCGVEYVVKFNLQQHLERIHTKRERETMPPELIKCTVCAALFYNKRAYNIHNTYHHPDDLYVTSEEQRTQMVTRIDQDFDVRRVQSMADRYVSRSNVIKRKNRKKIEAEKTIIKTEIKRERSVSLDDPACINEFNESSDSESDIPLKQRITS